MRVRGSDRTHRCVGGDIVMPVVLGATLDVGDEVADVFWTPIEVPGGGWRVQFVVDARSFEQTFDVAPESSGTTFGPISGVDLGDSWNLYLTALDTCGQPGSTTSQNGEFV